MWLRQLGQRERRKVRIAELQHLGRECEGFAVGADIPELHKGVQEAPRGCPGEVGPGCDFAEGHDRIVRIERPDHGQTPGQRLNVLVAGLRGYCRFAHGYQS
ncbi:hypothetical protein StoSoilB13_28380 (plasmid) [Arthrobacter sp. StoSoilB13]|nr:hypothetical protein StoSoilB13_28380 [Arthrobacter sp. StoSoilB13]